MSTFLIGDLQACLDSFDALLDRCAFDPVRDRLVLLGDLVARGPDSLGTLRRVMALGDRVEVLLGNHDLHLLAVMSGLRPAGADLAPILAAPDRADIFDWLRSRRLAWHDAATGTLAIHAALPPQWDLDQTLAAAADVEAMLRDAAALQRFLPGMYGDHPDRWSASLSGTERLRFTINCLTRGRYCTAEGRFDFHAKGAPGSQAAGLLPWFTVPTRRSAASRIVFGHWSTLGRVTWPEWGVIGLDTGCVWGGSLTALRLEDGTLLDLPCPGRQSPASD